MEFGDFKEYGLGGQEDKEFCGHRTEYFQERTTPQQPPRPPKRRAGRGVWKFAFYLSGTAFAAVTLGLGESGTQTVAETIAESAVIQESEAGAHSAALPVVEAETEAAVSQGLTEEETAYLNQLIGAFEAEDMDTLDGLMRQEIFGKIYDGAMQEGKLVFSEGELYGRTEFTGTGLLFYAREYEDGMDREAYLGALQNGKAEGDGKFIISNTQEDDQPGWNTDFYIGAWSDNAAEGQGVIYCRHEHDMTETMTTEGEGTESYNLHISQSDEGHGEFFGGRIKNGTSSFHQVHSGGANAEILFEYTYENGIIVSDFNHVINYDANREYDSYDTDTGREEDHFADIELPDAT